MLIRKVFFVSCFALLLWTHLTQTADAKRRPRKQKYSHKHSHAKKDEEKEDSHGHSHGHNHAHSPFSFTLGLTYSAAESDGEEGGDHSGHSHGLVSEGHSHDAGGAGGGEAKPEPVISAGAGYRFNETLSTNLGIGFGFDSGVFDPSLGLGLSKKLAKNTSLSSTISATAPLSEASKESYKMTTVTVSLGPNFLYQKYTTTLRAALSKSYYSQTIIVEEEDEEAKGESPFQQPISYAMIEDDHDHDEGEEEHEVGDEGTGDREFDRYSVSANLSYRLIKAVSVGMGGSGSYVTHQFGDSTVESLLTVVQGAYTYRSFTGAAAFLLTGSGESFEFPSSPGFSLGLMYIYE